MWEDGTYLTSQSNDMDTSPGARLFNTWTNSHANSYKQRIKHMEYLVFLEKEYGAHVILVFFAPCSANKSPCMQVLCTCCGDLLAEQGGLTEQISMTIYLPVFSQFTEQ